ncbi:Rad52/Rad22 family DNA repair protein [Brevibacillus daliensis]|uniref:Rad52/Rad22 family DNA repair protein n=1 Tax=Brevibacillus daliensis TaxID=2892995 RepID=UPI001E5C2EA6|nr:Rad52/Rad22 family DNA repair protein [Brevibacillus daliensis]
MPFEHLNFDELEQLWKRIQDNLTKPFPLGSVQFRNRDGNGAYIPSRVYIHRLNEEVGSLWSWKITSEVIDRESNKVQVNGVLKILHREHEGMGFHDLQTYHDNPGKFRNYEDAKRAAAADALRDACDHFEMGWVDLAPYREWAKNPGIGLQEVTSQTTSDKCVVCKKELSKIDEQALLHYEIRNKYCVDHIPEHMTRKKDTFISS